MGIDWEEYLGDDCDDLGDAYEDAIDEAEQCFFGGDN